MTAYLLCLLISTFLIQIGLSSNIPVQVDLIFPKDSAVYQPVYPFPIVFAVHNFSTAWKFKPVVHWALTKIEDSTQSETYAGVGSIGWADKRTVWNPPSNKFLAINSSHYPSSYNQSAWILKYAFFLDSPQCSGSLWKSPGDRIYFNTSLTNGLLPDLAAFDSCPTSTGSITVEDQNETDQICARLASHQSDPISCAFNVDQQVFDQVSKEMVKTSRCSNVTWPNLTGMSRLCGTTSLLDGKKSNGNVLWWNPVVIGIFVVFIAAMAGLTLD